MFSEQSYWVHVPVTDEEDPAFVFLVQNIGLPEDWVRSIRGGWIVDPYAAEPNFNQLSPAHADQIRRQIKTLMNARYEFLAYNGITRQKAHQWFCPAEPDNAPPKNPFDDRVVVIDEVHNLSRRIANTVRRMKVEPLRPNPQDKRPTKCVAGKSSTPYPVGYVLYRLLLTARNCKVIALSGTPMINMPQEIAVIGNILTGQIEVGRIPCSASALLTSSVKSTVAAFLRKHPYVDYFYIDTDAIHITRVPHGLRKVLDERGALLGIETDPGLLVDAYVVPEFMPAFTEMVRKQMKEKHLPVLDPEPAGAAASKATLAVSRRREEKKAAAASTSVLVTELLPSDERQFVDSFVNRQTLDIFNEGVIMHRLSGLVSFYKGASLDLLPRVVKDERVYYNFSPYHLTVYEGARKVERNKEIKKKKPQAGAKADTANYEKIQSMNDTYMIRTRMLCNFVFPEKLNRPRMKLGNKALVDEEGKPMDDDEMDDEADAMMAQADMDVGLIDVGDDALENAGAADVAAVAAVAAAGDKEGAPAETTDRRELARIRRVAMAEYSRELEAALETLRDRDDVFSKAGLRVHSPKYLGILERIEASPGAALVYSQFKSLEGLNLFGVALEHNGYAPLRIERGSGADEWVLKYEPEEFDKPKYLLYTGDQNPIQRKVALNIINDRWQHLPASMRAELKRMGKAIYARQHGGAKLPDNKCNNQYGLVARVMMITESGAEGITLYNVRQVHIMEPYWNTVRTEQVKGRAIRLRSHHDLPVADRNVEIYTHMMAFSDEQKKTQAGRAMDTEKGSNYVNRISYETAQYDNSKTTDEIIDTIATKKQTMLDRLLRLVQASAVDCEIHLEDNKKAGSTLKACYLGGRPKNPALDENFLYHPHSMELDIKDLESAVRSKSIKPK
jgi:hypothetical protein